MEGCGTRERGVRANGREEGKTGRDKEEKGTARGCGKARDVPRRGKDVSAEART